MNAIYLDFYFAIVPNLGSCLGYSWAANVRQGQFDNAELLGDIVVIILIRGIINVSRRMDNYGLITRLRTTFTKLELWIKLQAIFYTIGPHGTPSVQRRTKFRPTHNGIH